jgi:NADP-dependent 3-hydroxy acid dehydrogenase YdfG
MCAYTLARNGAKGIIVDLLSAEDIINKIKSDFPDRKVDSYQVDIRNREEVQMVIDESVNNWGDIVANNTGTYVA